MKKVTDIDERRQLAAYVIKEHRLSIQKACQILNVSRTAYYYRFRLLGDENIIVHLQQLVEKHPCYGFRKLFHLLRKKA